MILPLDWLKLLYALDVATFMLTGIMLVKIPDLLYCCDPCRHETKFREFHQSNSCKIMEWASWMQGVWWMLVSMHSCLVGLVSGEIKCVCVSVFVLVKCEWRLCWKYAWHNEHHLLKAYLVQSPSPMWSLFACMHCHRVVSKLVRLYVACAADCGRVHGCLWQWHGLRGAGEQPTAALVVHEVQVDGICEQGCCAMKINCKTPPLAKTVTHQLTRPETYLFLNYVVSLKDM